MTTINLLTLMPFAVKTIICTVAPKIVTAFNPSNSHPIVDSEGLSTYNALFTICATNLLIPEAADLAILMYNNGLPMASDSKSPASEDKTSDIISQEKCIMLVGGQEGICDVT